MMKRNLPATLIAAALAAASLAPVSCFADEQIRVALITDYGDITDQSFNQASYEACKSFCEGHDLEYTYYKPGGDSTAERVSMIDKAVADGYDVLIAPGYAFSEALLETADLYPDVRMIAMDVSADDLGGDIPANVYSAVYKEELAGYMAGYAAVRMGYSKLGFLGGMAVPGVMRYGYGYVQGADAAAAEIGADVEINYIYASQFYGDADITAVMDTWYYNGTEVVFACGGGVYTSAAEAAVKYDGKVIGVDVDQAAVIDTAYGDGLTVTSAMKGLEATIYTLLDAVMEGKWEEYGGQVQSLGIISAEDPALNYVQLPLESTQWNDTFTKEDYLMLVKNLADGTITVSDDITATEPSAETAVVNFLGSIK